MYNFEIERKFLVASDSYKSLATSSALIIQGYLSVTPQSTVRIRRYGDKAYLTIKGRPQEGHIGRMEWEREISVDDFNTLFPLCTSGIVEKTRWLVPLNSEAINREAITSEALNLTVEVDEFHGANVGLVLAEIEMPSEDTELVLPDFLGQEVTSDHRYYNSYLSVHPFTTW